MSPTAITLTDRLQLLNFYAKKIRERKEKREKEEDKKGESGKAEGRERKRQKGGGKKDLIHVSFCGCPWIEPTSASATDGNREQEGGGEARRSDIYIKIEGHGLPRRCSFTPMAVRLLQIIPSHSKWSTGIDSLPRSIQSREKFPLKHQPNGLLSHYISETALHVFLHSLCD